jgi:hypothetical protein
MYGIMEWPGCDKDELFGFHNVINEPDFLPLHFVRILAQAAKLFRSYRGKLVPTPLGRKVLSGEQHAPLQALLFHVAFWRLNLGYFDRYPVDTWPQNEVGVVLWSLSASAYDWLPRKTLTRLCAKSGGRRPGVAMGFRLQCHGGPHSPTFIVVRAPGVANRREVADRGG